MHDLHLAILGRHGSARPMSGLVLLVVALVALVICGYYAQILFGGKVSYGAAVAQNTDYNGPSVADRVVATRIGTTIYRFPRNDIIGDFNGLRLGLELGAGGVTPKNIGQFERWGGGNRFTPSLVEAEITSGSPSRSTADYRRTLKAEHAEASLDGLLGYRMSPESLHYVPKTGEPALIFCDDRVGNCQMTFDVRGGNGVLVRFSRSRLPDWQPIRSFVKDVVERHGEDLK